MGSQNCDHSGDEGMSPHTDTLDMHLVGLSVGVKTQRNISNKI